MIGNVKKILAPTDFSEYSMEALRGAMELAKDHDGQLHIVHVVAPHFALFDKMREEARETLMVEEAEEELAPPAFRALSTFHNRLSVANSNSCGNWGLK